MSADPLEFLGGTTTFKNVESSYSDLRMEYAQAQAKLRGQVVVLPGPRELFVDIDSVDQLKMFFDRIEKLKAQFEEGHVNYVIRSSRSGGDRFHIVVTLPLPLQPFERIAYQAILGSDPVRELLSIARINYGCEHPTIFFEDKNNG